MGAWIALRAATRGLANDAHRCLRGRECAGDLGRRDADHPRVAQRRPVLQPLVARGADGLERPGRSDRRAPVRAGRRPVARPRRGRLGGGLRGDAAEPGHPGRATLPGRRGGALAADALGRPRVRDLRARGRPADGSSRGGGGRSDLRRGGRPQFELGWAEPGAVDGRRLLDVTSGRRPAPGGGGFRVRRRPVAAAALSGVLSATSSG